MEKPTYAYYKHKYYRYLLRIKGTKFQRHFNFYSFIDKKSARIKHIDNKYYLISENIDWRFTSEATGVYAYLFGLEQRKNYIKDCYMIDNFIIHKGDVVIDCGAAQGLFYLAVKNFNPEYYGFEPSPTQFDDLEYNLSGEKNIYNKALWKSTGEALQLFVNDWNNDSSAIQPDEVDEVIKVETLSLDDLIETIGKNIKLIKIEAEGAEPEVLEGLDKNISKVNYITIDAGFERNGKSTISECIHYLLARNFELIDFYQDRVGLLFKNRNIKKN